MAKLPTSHTSSTLHEIEVVANPDTNFVTLVLSEAQKLYGKDFEFETLTITNHFDGTYSVEFLVRNRVMVKDSGGLFASRPWSEDRKER